MGAERLAAKRSRVAEVGRGLRKGSGATLTMTGAFAAFELIDWIGQLPPRQLIQRLLPDSADERTVNVITAAAHMTYGALLGGTLALLTRSPTSTRGAVFGLAVCLANYEVVLPLSGIRQPLHRDDPREIAALIVAHLVYGADLGRRLAAQTRPPVDEGAPAANG